MRGAARVLLVTRCADGQGESCPDGPAVHDFGQQEGVLVIDDDQVEAHIDRQLREDVGGRIEFHSYEFYLELVLVLVEEAVPGERVQGDEPMIALEEDSILREGGDVDLSPAPHRVVLALRHTSDPARSHTMQTFHISGEEDTER